MSKFIELLDESSYPTPNPNLRIDTRSPSHISASQGSSQSSSPTTSTASNVSLEETLAQTRLRSPSTSTAGSAEGKTASTPLSPVRNVLRKGWRRKS